MAKEKPLQQSEAPPITGIEVQNAEAFIEVASKIKLDMAQQFLSTLASEDEDSIGTTQFAFRAFFDNKELRKKDPDKYPPFNKIGTFEELAPKLSSLNKRGYGVFLSVNETDSKGA